MKRFWLERSEDISGTSGTGTVAEGVVFSNGWCALHWLSKYTSVAFYQSVAELEAIHGHNGATRVRFEDSTSTPETENCDYCDHPKAHHDPSSSYGPITRLTECRDCVCQEFRAQGDHAETLE